ncbi:carboxypeptidase B-like isoform X3 [Daphnia pulex]|uniref:carboxypeptidase B-like isoform X2 n=1 Tax=Daphnia pulex TaxID=6669 RepID=UPI001EDEBAA4|nr:carboxypeptidase B-like isoform X2 [Daphnia pulex]XP_046443449.1 carboxypeptidase B-like isoform X3 [Daphnia pulex]
MKVLLLLALLAVSALAAQKRYDGYKVIQVKPKNVASFNALTKLYERQNSIYDFWTEPRSLDEPIDIMVPPTHAKEFEKILRTYNLEHRVKIQDVQSAIDVSRKDQASPTNVKDPRSRSGSSRYVVNWTEYHDYTTISVFLAQIAQAHPDIVTLKTIGKTHENREMYMVKISNTQANSNVTKNAILVDGGIHAREWIAPAFNTWLINELVENYAAHPEYLDNLDWYILPVMNPDGYVYSFADDRLWRKNRNPVNGPCVGIDLNRNFGFHWNEGGAAGNGCDDTYHGPTAFSEDESANARDAILSIAERTQVYLSYHSYSQVWLTPWGYTVDLPEDYPLLFDLAQNAVNNLTAVYGTQYAVGSTTGLLYVASGGSIDWIKGEAGIPYAYTVELRDTGDFGFLLPADQILPNNLEMWEAVKVIAEYTMNIV